MAKLNIQPSVAVLRAARDQLMKYLSKEKQRTVELRAERDALLARNANQQAEIERLTEWLQAISNSKLKDEMLLRLWACSALMGVPKPSIPERMFKKGGKGGTT